MANAPRSSLYRPCCSGAINKRVHARDYSRRRSARRDAHGDSYINILMSAIESTSIGASTRDRARCRVQLRSAFSERYQRGEGGRVNFNFDPWHSRVHPPCHKRGHAAYRARLNRTLRDPSADLSRVTFIVSATDRTDARIRALSIEREISSAV